MGFRVEQVDHVHVYVRDRREAARWYERVLGLSVVESHSDSEEGGPLVVSSDGGSTGLALFRRSEDETWPSVATTVAFRVGGEGFLAFLARQGREAEDGEASAGPRLTREDVIDHDYCYSVYFSDPDGNPYELTTYDYEAVREGLALAEGGAQA